MGEENLTCGKCGEMRTGQEESNEQQSLFFSVSDEVDLFRYFPAFLLQSSLFFWRYLQGKIIFNRIEYLTR